MSQSEISPEPEASLEDLQRDHAALDQKIQEEVQMPCPRNVTEMKLEKFNLKKQIIALGGQTIT